MEDIFVPESLEQCKQHYVPPNPTHIICKYFGNIDTMDGSCWWCKEMTPYQWHMCQDESWVRGLLSPVACKRADSRDDAVAFIEEYKQQHYSMRHEEYVNGVGDDDGAF